MVADYQKYPVKYSEVLVLMVVGNRDIVPLDVADKAAVDKVEVDKVVADKAAVDRAVVDKVEADRVADKVVDKVVGMAADRNYQAVFLYLQQ